MEYNLKVGFPEKVAQPEATATKPLDTCEQKVHDFRETSNSAGRLLEKLLKI